MDLFSFSFFCCFPLSLSNASMGRLTSSTRCKFLDLCMLMPFEIMKEICKNVKHAMTSHTMCEVVGEDFVIA